MKRLALLALLLATACAPTRRDDDDSDRRRDPPDGSVDDRTPDAGPDLDAPCESSADCDAPLVCRIAEGRCAECRTSDDCAGNQRCDDGTCVAAAACAGDAQCTSQGLVCDRGAGRCVECLSKAECGEGLECRGHSCVEAIACQSSLECAPMGLVCGGGACVECAVNGDCAGGAMCQDGFCVDVCARAGRVCGSVEGVQCGTCQRGNCTSLGTGCLSQLGQVWEQVEWLVLDGAFVYVGTSYSRSSGRVQRVDVGSGQTKDLVTLSSPVDAIAVNATHVFWIDTGLGQIRRLSKAGGTPQNVAAVKSDCWGMAADDQFVYCSRRDYDNYVNDGLYRAPVGGGTLEKLASGEATDALVLHGGRLYWAEGNNRNVRVVDVDGRNLKTLATNQNLPEHLFVHDGHVYWHASGNGEGEIRRVPLAGGTPQRFRGGSRAWGTSRGIVFQKNGVLLLAGQTESADVTLLGSGEVYGGAFHVVAHGESLIISTWDSGLLRLAAP